MNGDILLSTLTNVAVKRISDEMYEVIVDELDRHNDKIAVYVKFVYGKIILTDDEYYYYDIISCHDSFDVRQEVLSIISKYNVKLIRNELVMETNEKNLKEDFINYVKAIKALNTYFDTYKKV